MEEMKAAIKSLAKKYSKVKDSITNEETAKTALVLPFFQSVLGYDVHDPTIVRAEYTCDIADKKGEKIDYAILNQSGELMMLIECKWGVSEKDKKEHWEQLARYFSVRAARIGVLTDGLDYEFYADLDSEKALDLKPFLKFNINNVTDADIKELSKFTQEKFKIEQIIPAAEGLKYTGEMKRYLIGLMDEPDDNFTTLMTRKVYGGRLNESAKSKFKDITKKAFSQFMSEYVTDYLATLEKEHAVRKANAEEEMVQVSVNFNSLETTAEETFGYSIIKAIACKIVPLSRVSIRDSKSYCSVLLDDNNRYSLCRMHFNSSKNKFITVFNNESGTRFDINDIEDIYKHSSEIMQAIQNHLKTIEGKRAPKPKNTETGGGA